MPRAKKVVKTAPKVVKPKKVETPPIEITPLPEVPVDEVTIKVKLGKSTVTARTTVQLFKQDVWRIWDKALADLDELNAQP